MRNVLMDQSQAGIKLARRNNNKLRYTDDTTLMAKSEKALKSLLMRVKEESEKAGLNLNIQKAKIMASGLITSWQIEGEKVEAVADSFGGSKITAEGDCSHKKTLDPWKESHDKPRHHIKNRDITLPTKVHLVKAIVSPVVMYGCKN